MKQTADNLWESRPHGCGGKTMLVARKPLKTLATPAGLEPATCRLEGGCSIQLSYGAER